MEKELDDEYQEDMQQAILEGQMANNDFVIQKKYEERLDFLNQKIEAVKRQLIEIEYYISIPDEISAKIKYKYLLEAVNELGFKLNNNV